MMSFGDKDTNKRVISQIYLRKFEWEYLRDFTLEFRTLYHSPCVGAN